MTKNSHRSESLPGKAGQTGVNEHPSLSIRRGGGKWGSEKEAGAKLMREADPGRSPGRVREQHLMRRGARIRRRTPVVWVPGEPRQASGKSAGENRGCTPPETTGHPTRGRSP